MSQVGKRRKYEGGLKGGKDTADLGAAAGTLQHQGRRGFHYKSKVNQLLGSPQCKGMKTLIIDLDETLIHRSLKPVQNPMCVIPEIMLKHYV